MWLHFTTIFKISLVLQNSVSADFSYEVYSTVTILKLFSQEVFLDQLFYPGRFSNHSILKAMQVQFFKYLCSFDSVASQFLLRL